MEYHDSPRSDYTRRFRRKRGRVIVVGLVKSYRNFLSAMTRYEVQRRTKDDRLYKRLVLYKDGFFYTLCVESRHRDRIFFAKVTATLV